MDEYIVKQVENLYTVIKLKEFRKTEGVSFDIMIGNMIPKIDSIDRVLHKGAALSPGSTAGVERPWYMHPHQADNLLVLRGTRHIEVYTPEHGKVENFTVTPEYIEHNGERILEGGGLVVWPPNVFHRIRSEEDGSASVNLATHYEGFNIKRNFDIFDLDTESGEYELIREGYRDQI